jgi:3-phosphoshikimate 1-carboxyvinyltransferase
VILEIDKATFNGKVNIPGSKSVAQRAIAASMLAHGISLIYQAGRSGDVLSALHLARACGADVERNEPISIFGRGMVPSSDMNAGESGLASRMFLPLLALSDKQVTLHGEGSLLARPFEILEKVLPSLGVQCRSNQGKLPFKIQGPLQGGEIFIDGSTSSQFVTGLLMALPLCSEDSIIHVENAISKPYLQLTIEVMRHYGIEIEHTNLEDYKIPGGQFYDPAEIVIPVDWSAAANFLVLGALTSEHGIIISNPGQEFTQADAHVMDVLRDAGVQLEISEKEILAKKSVIRAFSCDLSNSPDLFPPIAVLAVFADGPSHLKGARRLKYKESNRAMVIVDEFSKAGIHVDVDGDDMIVYPGTADKTIMDARNDHRIAMATAILGSASKGMRIRDAHSVDKSFPDFFDQLDRIRIQST